jgi:hypothetical protein
MQDDRSEMDTMKVVDPNLWCKFVLAGLEASIAEHNKIARSWNRNNEEQLDIIVAFTMTEAEEKEFLDGQV